MKTLNLKTLAINTAKAVKKDIIKGNLDVPKMYSRQVLPVYNYQTYGYNLIVHYNQELVVDLSFHNTLKGDKCAEVHFYSVTQLKSGKKGVLDFTRGDWVTGLSSPKDILSMFSWIKSVCQEKGYHALWTYCDHPQRRRIYILAGKRLGFEVKEVGDIIYFLPDGYEVVSS